MPELLILKSKEDADDINQNKWQSKPWLDKHLVLFYTELARDEL